MDKLLFSTFFAFLAALLTAVISLIKLISDKEGKISEQRQQWSNSARKSLADMVSSATVLIELKDARDRKAERLNKLTASMKDHTDKDHCKRLIDYEKDLLEKIANEMLTEERNFYSASNLSRLHFKVDDALFNEINGKVRLFESTFKELDIRSKTPEKVKSNIDQILNDIILLSQKILKAEWETIKKGEPRFLKSLKYTKNVIYFLVFVIAIIFITATQYKNGEFLKIGKDSIVQSSSSSTSKVDAKDCLYKYPLINNTYLTIPAINDHPVQSSGPNKNR